MVRARGTRVWAALSVGTAAAVALTIHAQTPSQDARQSPSFRAGVNLVRVDVLATDRSGRPLETLTADDFEIRENGVRQAISSFKRVYLNGDREPGGDALRPITSDAIETTEAAREDVRLFAVLLDDYHVKRGSSLWVREQLARWVETQLGPADMVGVMDPLEAMADMHLTRDRDSAKAAFRRFTGRKHNYWPENEIEQRYVLRLKAEEIERTRNRVTFGAIEALIARLGALKEGRKSLILVSEGFADSLPAALVNYHGGLGGSAAPGVQAGGGGLATPDSSTFFKSVDLDMDLREVTNLANRQNVSIYPVDPRGLGAGEYGGDLPEVDDRTDRMYQQLTTTTLRVLAENTDGRAIVNRNDITMAMKQIVSDASGYYLLGYSSTLSASDGKFHPIDVRVKRNGIELRHRRGYWAPTAEEAVRATSTTPTAPAPNPVADAIGAVRARDTRMIHAWIGTAPGDAGRTRLTFVWETSARGAANPSARPARVLLGASTRDEAYFLGRVPEKPIPSAGKGSVAFDAPAGPVQLRISVEDANGTVLDSETRTVSVPDLTVPGAPGGSPELFRARTAQETERLKSDPHATPTASPLFSRAERLWIRLPVFGTPSARLSWTATLVSPGGATLSELHPDASRSDAVVFDVPIANLAPADYAVIIRTAASDDSRTIVAIRVTP